MDWPVLVSNREANRRKNIHYAVGSVNNLFSFGFSSTLDTSVMVLVLVLEQLQGKETLHWRQRTACNEMSRCYQPRKSASDVLWWVGPKRTRRRTSTLFEKETHIKRPLWGNQGFDDSGSTGEPL